MRSKIIQGLLILTMLFCVSVSGWAQKGLEIQSIFEQYGKRKGSTMVELSKEMLEAYNMKLYKSITIKNSQTAIRHIRLCLQKDQKDAKKIKEVLDGGFLISAFYQLPATKEDMNRFILFKVGKKESATLVYIEGKLDSEDLVTLLLMKDL